MKAVRLYNKNDIRVEDISFNDKIESEEVLVEVSFAGICGSDLHNFNTGCWISRSPSTPGHEFSGRILKIGDKVSKLRVNDHVVADSRVACGDCLYCKKNLSFLCSNLGFVGELNDGGFAKYTIQKESQLIKLPKSLDLKIACLIEPLAVSIHALSLFNQTNHKNVLILGLGPIGVLSAIYMRELGVNNIKIYDINKKRLSKVSNDLKFEVLDLNDEIINNEKFDFCLDATNSTNAISFILDRISKGGIISVVGLTHGFSEIEMHKIVENGITLKGCAAYDDELYKSKLFIKKIINDINKIISEPIALDDVPYYYQKLIKNETDYIKVIIQP